TPVPAQRFESINDDLLVPLPETTEETQSPVVPLKKRGRPRKQPLVPRGTAGENAIMSASTPPAETVFGGVGENVTTTFKPCLP
ncbi:hypothetical protein TNCV_3343071, partial [Trichonephila clavipes]